MNFKLKLLTLNLIALLIASSLNAQTNWHHQNPYPTAEDLNDIHVFDENTAIAVGNFGTVLKTTNGGLNWETNHKTANVTNNLNSVFFIDENMGWAVGSSWGSDSSVVIKTRDKGDTWELICFDIPYIINSIFFINENTGFACGSIYYSTENKKNIFKTIDGGKTWAPLNSNNEQSLSEIFFINSDIGWAIGSRGTILKTVDGGDTWESKSSGTDEGLYSIHFINEQIGWVVGWETIIISVDGGDNWFTLDIGHSRVVLNSVYFIDDNNGWVVGRSSSGGSIYLYKTTDGGDTWSYEYKNTDNYLYSIKFINNETGWTIGNAGTIYKTDDGGETWNQQFDGLNMSLSSVSFINSQIGWAAGGDGLVLKTTNGGASWTKLDSITSSYINYIKFFNENEGLFLCNTTVYNTNNGGETWIRQAPNKYYNISTAFFLNPDTGYAAGSKSSWSEYSGYILKTTDNGNTWEEKKSFSSQWSFDFEQIQFINQNLGYVLEEEYFCKTNDGGETWECGWSTPVDYPKDMYFLNENVGWIVGHDSKTRFPHEAEIAKTTDGGLTWADQGVLEDPWLNTVFFVNENTGWAMGDGGISYETKDSGETWTMQTITSRGIYDVFAIDANTVWCIGQDGLILHNKDLKTYIDNEQKLVQFPSEFRLYQNYPNPFNPFTTISFSLPKQSAVKIEIYNLLGQKVKTLLNNTLDQGFHKLHWDGLDETGIKVNSGMYIYRIKSNEFVKSRKMLLLK